jgi:hypothetical protein
MNRKRPDAYATLFGWIARFRQLRRDLGAGGTFIYRAGNIWLVSVQYAMKYPDREIIGFFWTKSPQIIPIGKAIQSAFFMGK